MTAERVVLFETPKVRLNVGARRATGIPARGCAEVKGIFGELRDRSEVLRGAPPHRGARRPDPPRRALRRRVRRRPARRRARGVRRPADLGARPRPRPPARARALPGPHHAHPRRRVPGHRSGSGRAGRLARDGGAPSRGPTGATLTPDARAACSWSATPSSRSTASAAPTSPPTTLVKRGPLGGRLAELVQSFRTTEPLLAWINAAFDRVLVESAGVQVGNARLAGHATSLDAALDRPSVVVAHGD